MSHFAFLDAEWPEIAADAKKAEAAAHPDPRTACFYARRALELAVNWLYRADRTLKRPYDDALSSLLHAPEFRQLVGPAILTKAKLIKDLGNAAVHTRGRSLAAQDGPNAVRELFHVCFWLARSYGRKARPEPGLAFRAEALPRTSPTPPQTQAVLAKLAADLEARDAALAEAQARSQALDAELATLRAEIAAVKAANAATPGDHDYDEATTRDAYIDLLLREAGWALDQPQDREFKVEGMPNAPGVGYVDYVLWGADGKPLAVVEAKRTRRDAREGQEQARLYADCLEQRYGRRPVIFYTNGYEHWLWEDAIHPPRAVQGFLKRDELELLIQRRASRRPLIEVAINEAIVERHYQTRAIRNIGKAFEKDRDRKALVVMATGAGKTRTVIALVDQLMRANWVRRVLFLADRVALVNQAVKAFKAHLPDQTTVNLVTERGAQGRVYVSTYPTMMGLINEKEDERRFGVGHFDLIIVDEAHRSIYQKYRAIFDYFDALLLGLTATPKDEIDRNTFDLFDVEDGVPTDVYGLDEAVRDGYLVPPKAISVGTLFLREGIRYDERSEDEKDQWDALEWNEEGEVPDEVTAAQINQTLFNAHTVDLVLAELMTKGIKVAGGDRLGKTIVFAANRSHAEFIEQRFNIAYPHYAGQFARVIHYKTDYAQNIIDDFSVKERAPHIAISVDMLDTGIDVPEVVNLVFFKVVRSKTKFWQMIGRGTRLCPDLFGPGENKTHFAVLDFCGNLDFFAQDPETLSGAVAAPLGERLFAARLALIGELVEGRGEAVREDRAPYEGDTPETDAELRAAHIAHLREQVAAMTLDNFVVRPKRKFVEAWQEEGAWADLSAERREELLEHVAGLPSAMADEDEDAKRFDLIVFQCTLALLRAEERFTKLKQRIVDIAEALEGQAAIPMVNERLALIQEVQTDAWWQDVTAPMLEVMRRRLRAIVNFIDKRRRNIVYSNFADELAPGREVALPHIAAGLDVERFTAKARHYLRTHENHLAVHKLRRNEPLTATDLSELERILIEVADGDVTLVQAAAGPDLPTFVRGLVGLDRAAVMAAFSEFIAKHNLAGDQIHFVNLIIDHLTQNGAMAPERLYESPFTDIDPSGVGGVFDASAQQELVAIVRQIGERVA
ncbi:MAG: DEAD/DEAH box helicase family protein [Hyphomonadaceae bacterium]